MKPITTLLLRRNFRDHSLHFQKSEVNPDSIEINGLSPDHPRMDDTIII